MQAKGIPKEKIDLIPHAVFSFYEKFTENTENSRPPRSVLFFGRITRYKGLEVLIQAFRICQAQWPDLRLSIADEGDMRPYRLLLDGVRNIAVHTSHPRVTQARAERKAGRAQPQEKRAASKVAST